LAAKEGKKSVMQGPVILLAPGRCFSSLICAMLGQHPQLYAILETQLLTRDTMDEWLAAFAGGIHSHGLLRAIAEIVYGGQRQEHIARARVWLARRCEASTMDILTELSRELSPLILVEKSPMVTYRPEHMHRARALLPDARFIHLVRHPVGYGSSLLEFFRKRGPRNDLNRVLADRESIFHGLCDLEAQEPIPDPQRAWYLRHSEVSAFVATLSLREAHLLRSETLLAQPGLELPRLCDWLELSSADDDVAQMLHPENSPFASLGPSGARYGGDPIFLTNPKLRLYGDKLPPLRSAPPWDDARQPLSEPVVMLARRFGYA
jgi:hypothetical protein